MKPLFWTELELETLTPPRALTRLAKAGIAVFEARRIGAGRVRFKVKSKDLQKIFAIFPRSCYTVNIIRNSPARRAAEFVKKRAVLCAMAAVFALLVTASGFFVLRIRFVGSGSWYAEEALPILSEAGVRAFVPFGEERAQRAERALSALPSVSFCSVEKEGLVVTVTIEVNAELPVQEPQKQFLSPADGRVESITVMRGTALVSEGDAVQKGQPLVSGEVIVGEGENAAHRQTYPVARCSLLCGGVYEYESTEKSEAAERRALAGALLRAQGEVVESSVTVSESGSGFVYRIDYTYRLVCSVNAGRTAG